MGWAGLMQAGVVAPLQLLKLQLTRARFGSLLLLVMSRVSWLVA